MIKVTLRDEVKEFPKGTTPADIAKEISMGLYRNLCACLINGQSADIRTPINEDCELELLTFDSAEGKHAFWHTASHILAQAVKNIFPTSKLAIGPTVENGFYYDIEFKTGIGEQEKGQRDEAQHSCENRRLDSVTLEKLVRKPAG